jgi:hypothetical protein
MTDRGLTLVSPAVADRAAKRGMEQLVTRIVAEIVRHRNPHNLLTELYMAGLYHGSALGGRLPEREADIIDVRKPARRRARAGA